MVLLLMYVYVVPDALLLMIRRRITLKYVLQGFAVCGGRYVLLLNAPPGKDFIQDVSSPTGRLMEHPPPPGRMTTVMPDMNTYTPPSGCRTPV